MQQYRMQAADRDSVTHTLTRRAGEGPVKLSVPAEGLADFYAVIANEANPPAIVEHMGKSTAYSIDLKVCDSLGDGR